MKQNGKRKTTEEFKKQVYDLTKNEYSVLGEYIHAKQKILFKHNECNGTFEMTPGNFLTGQRCPLCRYKRASKAMARSQKEFEEEVKKRSNNEYIVLSPYINSTEKVKFLHKLCGTEFYMSPVKFLIGQRCTNPNCIKKRLSLKRKYSPDKYKSEFDKISNGEYELLSEYTGANQKIKLRHLTCGNIFEIRPNNFQQGQRCPFCFQPTKGERKIIKYLEENNIEYIYQKRYKGLIGTSKLLSYDFYLPSYNLLIEYQGEFHDGSVKGKIQSKLELKKQKEYDNKKRQYAKDNNIELLEIWYKDFKNIETILQNKLSRQSFQRIVKIINT